MAPRQRARLDNPDATSSWYLRNRLPNASTALGVGLRSLPGAIWAGAKNIPAVLNREQGSLGQMGRDFRDTYTRNLARNAAFKAMDTAGQAADNYASERRGLVPDVMNTGFVRGVGNFLRRAGNVATRTLTGDNRMLNDNFTPNIGGIWGNFKNALAGEGASMAADYAGNQIKQRSPMAQKISDAWGRAKGAMGRGVDTLWDKLSGYEGARKEWSDYDRMKPINETYGGDPLAKAHDEMQRNIRENRGADISPDTMALLSPSQRFQFQNVQDEQRKALRERVAQDRIENPGAVGTVVQGAQKLGGALANGARALGNAVAHPVQTAQNLVTGAKNVANQVGQTVSGFKDLVTGGGEPMLDNNVFAGLDDELAVGGQSPYPPSTQQQVQQPVQQPVQPATAIGAPATQAQPITPTPAPQVQQPTPAQPQRMIGDYNPDGDGWENFGNF
jgi:hypothetical protein